MPGMAQTKLGFTFALTPHALSSFASAADGATGADISADIDSQQERQVRRNAAIQEAKKSPQSAGLNLFVEEMNRGDNA